jgi:hypothetical protein
MPPQQGKGIVPYGTEEKKQRKDIKRNTAGKKDSGKGTQTDEKAMKSDVKGKKYGILSIGTILDVHACTHSEYTILKDFILFIVYYAL